jgi:hypothetical protein
MLPRPGSFATRTPAPSPGALKAIDRDLDVPSLTYTGEVEDFFFLIEAELRRRIGPDIAGRLHTAARATTSTTPCSSSPQGAHRRLAAACAASPKPCSPPRSGSARR